MKTILNYILGFVSLAVMTACTPEELTTTFQSGEGTLQLSFTLDNPDSRVVAEDVINSSEIEIDRVDIFFYKKEGNAYTYLFRDNDVKPSAMTQNNTEGHNHFECTAQITIPTGVTFNGETYKIYVVANSGFATDGLSSKLTNPSSTDVEDLKALSFASALETVINGDTRFIMDGEKDVTISNKNEVSDEIVLTRAAAKIVFDLSVYAELTASDYKKYTPILKDGDENSLIKVSFNNGVKTVNYETPEVFNTAQWEGDAGTKDEENNLYPIAIDPFYTYPVEWEMSNENEPYLMLEIPWMADGSDETDYQTYYYRIPVNRKFMNADNTKLCLKRNNMYKISINIGVLGSTDPNAPAIINNAQYSIMDWGLIPIGTEIRDYKYLVVEKNELEIFNQNTASVAFSSSHPITLEIVSIKKWDYSTEDGTELNYAPASDAPDKSIVAAKATPTNGSRKLLTECKVSESADGKTIDLSHVLVNKDANTDQDLDGNGKKADDYDYVYYTITVKVTNEFYTEYITYKQYPEVYIQADTNKGGNIVREDRTDKDKGYVFVYNNQSSGSANWQVVRSCAEGGNNNPNMYIVTVTALDANSSWYIGDPRVDTPVSGSTMQLTNAFNNKTLTNYYPTRTDNTDIIAPQFRMASSYGKCGSGISHADAKKRCAAYQEYGYPAGRWRLPTVAEFEYVQSLSDNGIIPQLYTSGSNYWTATTAYSYGSGPSNSTTAYVRCVYDDWYWSNNQISDMSVYTWGD